MINIRYILSNIPRLIINFMNTEVLRKLKTIMEITRKLANIPKLQPVTVKIVDVGNGYGRVTFCPTALVVFQIESIKVCCILHCATFPIPIEKVFREIG